MWPFTRERSIPEPEPQAPPAPTEPPLLCSFCGKTQDEVRKLIAGPSVYICDECIDLCNDIIAEEIAQSETDPPKCWVCQDASKRRDLINVPRGVSLCRDCFHAMRSLRNKK